MRKWTQMLLAAALLSASACKTAPIAKKPQRLGKAVTLEAACAMRDKWAGKAPPVYSAGQTIEQLQGDLLVAQKALAHCYKKAHRMWIHIREMNKDHADEMSTIIHGK